MVKKLKNRALFGNRVYDKEKKYFKTKAQAQKRLKKFKETNHYAVLDKRKKGWFVWYNRTSPSEREEERRALKKSGLKRGTIIHDIAFDIKYKIVGAYGTKGYPKFSIIDVNDEKMSIGSLSVNMLEEKKRYKIIRKKK